MVIEDKFTVSAPQQQVWDFLLDIPAVSACIPGVENVKQVNPETFRGSLEVRVGPIKANFGMEAVLTETIAPHKLIAKAQGKDRSTGSMVTATFTATLVELDSSLTEVRHHLDMAVRGRLGQFGQGVIRETAKQITTIFADCLQAKIVSSPPATPASREVPEIFQMGTKTKPQSSMVTIMFRAILATIKNWFRSLLGQPTD